MHCTLSFDLPSPLQCTYINGSPQNTFVPGVVELAQQKNVFLAGDDFKSGQTKVKSVLTDFLVSAGIKVGAHFTYTHTLTAWEGVHEREKVGVYAMVVSE